MNQQRSRHMPETRQDTRDSLEERGIRGRVADAYLDATGPDRHAARVQRFIDAACQEYLRVTDRSNNIPPICCVEAFSYAIAVLVLDAFGVVADNGPNEQTQKIHHRAFRNGCGPRIGDIASATHAAARGAVDQLWRRAYELCHNVTVDKQFTPASITLRPSLEPAGIIVKAHDLPPITLPVEPTESIDAQSPSWLHTIALEGMRRGMKSNPWFQLMGERPPIVTPGPMGPSIFDLIVIEGDPVAWATVLDDIIERLRVDGIAQSLINFARDMRIKEPLFWLPPWRPRRARRVSLEYVKGWVTAACGETMGDETAIGTCIKYDSGNDLSLAILESMAHELEAFSAARMMRRTDIGGYSCTEDAAIVLLMLLEMANCKVDADRERQRGYAERAMKAIAERHGPPVLYPEPSIATVKESLTVEPSPCSPSIGLHFEERMGILATDAIRHMDRDYLTNTTPALARIVLGMMDRNEVRAGLAGARIIGTRDEWAAIAG